MNERILINENKGQALAFEGSVQKAVKKLNELIEQFHSFQTWQRVSSESDFLKLVHDPEGYFDEVLTNNSGIKASTKLNPEAVASLLNIDRDSWLTYLKGKSVASSSDYDQDYMIFRDGKFFPDQSRIQEKKDSFAVYAETPGQVRIVETFRDLVDTLNWLQAENICNATEVENAATALKLFYSRDMGKVLPMDELVLTSITYKR